MNKGKRIKRGFRAKGLISLVLTMALIISGMPFGSKKASAADLSSYVTAGTEWNAGSYWSVYFAYNWGNNPTGRYYDGNSYSDYSLYVDTASLTAWGIQMKTQPITVTSGKEYTCKITVDFNSNMTDIIRFKDEITQTETAYTLVDGTNTLELKFTPTTTSAQIFFDLGLLPAGAHFQIKSFSLTNGEEETTTEETTTQVVRDLVAFETIEAEHFTSKEGGVIDTNSNASGGYNMGGMVNGVVLQYDNVSFAEEAGGLSIYYSSPPSEALGKMEVYIDNTSNLVGTVELANNANSWSEYGMLTAELDSTISAGTHNVYLKFVTTGTKFYVANVDYFTFIRATEYDHSSVVIATEGLEVNGYQISSTAQGMRSVYSVDSTINGKEVVASGLIYSLADYANISDMYIGSTSSYVANFESTVAGVCGKNYSDLATATSYAMTMKFSNKNAAEYTAKWRIRAYAKLSDGTYVYTECYTYQIYDIADKLYQKQYMSHKPGHNYLYTDILTVVNPAYVEVEYELDNTVATW